MLGMKWTLIGVFTSQVGKTMVFRDLIKKTEQYDNGNLVFVGDFNAVMDKALDKSGRHSSKSGMPQVFRK